MPTPADVIVWADVLEKLGMGFVAFVAGLIAVLKAPPLGPFLKQWLAFKLDEMAQTAMRDHGKSIATHMKDALDIDQADAGALAVAAKAAVDEKLTELGAKGMLAHMEKVAGSPEKLRASLLAVADKHIGKGMVKAIKDLKP